MRRIQAGKGGAGKGGTGKGGRPFPRAGFSTFGHRRGTSRGTCLGTQRGTHSSGGSPFRAGVHAHERADARMCRRSALRYYRGTVRALHGYSQGTRRGTVLAQCGASQRSGVGFSTRARTCRGTRRASWRCSRRTAQTPAPAADETEHPPHCKKQTNNRAPHSKQTNIAPLTAPKPLE